MINLTAKPVWQWSGKNALPRSPSARSGKTGAAALKHALMPHSLDLEFSLKYRR